MERRETAAEAKYREKKEKRRENSVWRKENVGERKYANVHLEEKLSTFSLNLLFSSGLSSLRYSVIRIFHI